jgi:uncharacterized protein (TIGR02266 family)
MVNPCQLSFGMLIFYSMPQKKETRLSSRTRIQAQIVFKIPSKHTKDTFLTFSSENLSEGGVFLKSNMAKLPFSAGDIVELVFSLPGHPMLIKAKGKVIWTTEGWSKDLEGVNGFGVQFTEIKDEFKELIRGFVVENCDA